MRAYQDDFEDITKDIVNNDAFMKDENDMYIDENTEKSFLKFREYILHIERDGV